MIATMMQVEPRLPRLYQQEGVAWLRDKQRAFLTDGFGLGKTCQAIWAAETPALIAAPVHLLNHWQREILSCYPNATVHVASESGYTARLKQLAGPADFYVCNIELLRRDDLDTQFEPLSTAALSNGHGIKTFIVDEAHRLRGRSSLQTKGAMRIAQAVPRVYFLTATPVFNTPGDLYSLLHMLDPKRFNSYWDFITKYLAVLNTAYGPKITGLKRGKELLTVFKEYAMGRTRKQVAAQLPALQQSLVEIDPGPEWYKQYETLKYTYRDKYGKQQTSQQSVVQALRGHTQQPKLQAVCHLIADNDCSEHTLIYTYHKDLAYAIGHLLHAAVVTGDMPPLQREKVAQANDFVVATFPSVAEGLNFSHMQNVIFMEHDWQPGMIEQAMNRVHRPGNAFAHTNVYHVVVKRSIDSILYRTVGGRRTTMEEIVTAALVPYDQDS